MDLSKHYFRNGCTNCNGGEVYYVPEYFIYKCKRCKAFAHAHREKTLFANQHEPFQYLANQYINNLRKNLEESFKRIWRERITYYANGKKRDESMINVIMPVNIRKINDVFVKVISINETYNKCLVFSYEDHLIMENVDLNLLESVSNREKTYLWLSEELNIHYDACKIGFLSESELKTAIKICAKAIDYAKIRAFKQLTGDT